MVIISRVSINWLSGALPNRGSLRRGLMFQVLGDAEEDLFELMGQMVPRIRRLLAQQHLKTEPQCLDCISPIVRVRDQRSKRGDLRNGGAPDFSIGGRWLSVLKSPFQEPPYHCTRHNVLPAGVSELSQAAMA